MSLCIVTPRFYPVIGGLEIYLKNIAEYCSNYFKTFVITSNLRNFPRSLFEKSILIKEKYDHSLKNIEIIRSSTLNNFFLKALFYANQFLNKKIELCYDNHLNLHQDCRSKSRLNEIVLKIIQNILFHQRYYTNPNFSQIYSILNIINKENKIDLIHSCPMRFNSDILAFKFSKKKKNSVHMHTSLSY